MKIIALDGVDGCSKSTQSILLRDYLKIDLGKTVEHYQMPGSTELGKELRRVVKSRQYPTDTITERLIFAADTAQFFAEKIYTRREYPEFMVCDRWSPATDLVYSVAAGLDESWMMALQEACAIVKPCDLLIVFKCSYETVVERKGAMEKDNKVADRIEARGETFMRHVINGYHELAALDGGSGPALPEKWRKRANKIRAVNANEDREVIRDQIRKIVEQEFMLT